jgi:hypothetical protein
MKLRREVKPGGPLWRPENQASKLLLACTRAMNPNLNQAPQRYLDLAALLNAFATNSSRSSATTGVLGLREESNAGFIEISPGAALHARSGSNVARKECRTGGLLYRPEVCAAVFELVDPGHGASFGAHHDGFSTELVHVYRKSAMSKAALPAPPRSTMSLREHVAASVAIPSSSLLRQGFNRNTVAEEVMIAFKPRRSEWDPLDVELLERAVDAAMAAIKASGQSLDFDSDEDLEAALRHELIEIAHLNG